MVAKPASIRPIRSPTARLLAAALAGCALLAAPAAARAQRAEPAAPASLDGEPRAVVGRGGVVRYRLDARAGELVVVRALQQGVDVALRVVDPAGSRVAEIDSPNGTVGVERVAWIAREAGPYVVEVVSIDPDAREGAFAIRVEDRRVAAAGDRDYVEAQRRFARAVEAISEQEPAALAAAEADLRASAALWSGVGYAAGQAHALNRLGAIFTAEGRPRSALEPLGQALDIYLRAGDNVGAAFTLAEIGFAQFGDRNFIAAAKTLESALASVRKAGDAAEELLLLANLGEVHAAAGNTRAALDYFEQILPRMERDAGGASVAYALTNIGNLQAARGDFQAALDSLARALRLAQEAGDDYRAAVAMASTGTVYAFLGQPERATRLYGQALAVQRRIKEFAEVATLYNDVGFVYLGQQRYAAALASFARSQRTARRLGDRRGEALALTNVAKAQTQLGRSGAAAAACRAALRIWRETDDRVGEAITLDDLGCALVAGRQYRGAVEPLQSSLAMRQRLLDRNGEAKTRYDLARALGGLDRLEDAKTQIEEAIRVAEAIRASIGNSEYRSTYFATVRGFYEFYVDLLMRMHMREPGQGFDAMAFQASERGRARGLVELLAEANVDIRRGVRPELVERERELSQALAEKMELRLKIASGEASREQLDEVTSEIDSLTAEHERILTEIRSESPAYAALTQPVAVGVTDLQHELLDDETALVEYSLGDERSYLWVVTATTMRTVTLPPRAAVEHAARRLYTDLARPPGSTRSLVLSSAGVRSAPPTDSAIARSVAEASALVIGNVLDSVAAKRLLVVGDGALHYLPFSVLTKGSAQAGDAHPLVLDYEVIHLPSATALAVIRRNAASRPLAPKTLAVIADPVFSARDARIAAGVRGRGDRAPAARSVESRMRDLQLDDVGPGPATGALEIALPRLPGTRREAEALGALLPAGDRDVYLDFDADLAHASAPDLGRYRYIHFATHGLLDAERPQLSSLVFSTVRADGTPQHGFLRAMDVFNLILRADLVTLSACRTGLGKEIRGEGLVGITRAFMYAGAPRFLVSLWSVDDASTAELMADVYRRILVDGQRPAAAARAAQIDMLERGPWRSPYYWAPFVFIGEFR